MCFATHGPQDPSSAAPASGPRGFRMDQMLLDEAFAEEIESYRHRPAAESGLSTAESDALDVLKRYLQEPPVFKALQANP